MSDINFKKNKVIGFDLDQTLYPKSPEIDEAIQEYIYGKISKHLNISREIAKNKFIDLYHMQGKGAGNSLVEIGLPPEEARNAIQEALENADIAKFLHPNRKLIELLSKLRGKYILDIVTGSNKKNTLIKLSKLEIPVELFSNLITGDYGSKSMGTSYKLWLSKYPLYRPEEFLYIGDRPTSDYEVPSALGINCILVNTDSSDSKYNCLQLKSILDIKKYLI